MKDLLAPENLRVLERLASSRVVLAFDFDGTLAPITPHRQTAAMRATTMRLLSALCDRYTCAVVSGRLRDDVVFRLGEARVKYIVGNHGAEPGERQHDVEAVVAEVVPLLGAALAGTPGVEVEAKRYSVAVHYRQARAKGPARSAILAALERLPPGLRVARGKQVVDVAPTIAPHKGDAVDRIRAREGADAVLYLGDDVTDEDVFRMDVPWELVSVRVGASRASAARYHVNHQRDVDTLLERLVGLRDPGHG
jgi:trehalose 6-phosphate phosphatase